jgi:hypothetical protein
MRRMILMVVAGIFVPMISLNSMAQLAKALELKPGLKVRGQWEKGEKDFGLFSELRIISIAGNKVKLKYAVGRLGYNDITEDSFDDYDGNIKQLPSGVKEVTFVGHRSLADFDFTFNPDTPFVKGTWTNTRNQTWRIKMTKWR